MEFWGLRDWGLADTPPPHSRQRSVVEADVRRLCPGYPAYVPHATDNRFFQWSGDC